MSNFSTEEEKEQITFDNLQILDLIESDSIFEEAVCAINIYTPQSKIITIKMSQTNASRKSKDEKTQKNKEKAEEINEMKYNIFLALTKNCIPAYDEFSGVIENRYLKAKRLIIQDIEIPEYEAIFKPKKFIFIPRNNMPEFETDNGKVVFEKETENKNETMKLNGKDLISRKNFNIENIINEKKNSCSGTKETSTNIDYSPEYMDGNGSNKIIEKNNSTNVSEINDILQNKSKSKSSISSKINNSSEKEGDEGFVYYNEIDKYKKYTKYSYVEDFEKEVDGIYKLHDEINLIQGKKELEFENNNNYEYIKSNYNLKNGLCANIIIKNFVEESIPKDAPFILEVKAGFELSSILRQIKKASKFIRNMKKYNVALPVYFIGILCSFNKISIDRQFAYLNSKYNGSNIIDIKEGLNSYNHIKRIIEENGIKFVIGIIEDNTIEGYNLGIKDFEVDKSYRKVEIEYMYKTIKGVETIPENMLEKINIIRNMFSLVYCSVNLEFKIEMTYNEMKKKDNEIMKKDNELMKKEKMIESLKNQNDFLNNVIEEMKNDQLIYQKFQEIMEKIKKGSEENKKPEKNEEEKKGEN